jgi:hypothetical protein
MGFTQVDKFYASRVDDTNSRNDSNAAAKFDGSIACAKRVWSNNLLADSGIQSFGTLSVSGNTTLSSTLSVVGNSTLSGTLTVSGASSIGSTLNVTGTTTLNSDLTVSGNVGIGTLTPGAGLHVESPISTTPSGSGVLMGREGSNACIQMNSPLGSTNYIDFSTSGVDQLYRLVHNVTANTLQFQNTSPTTPLFMAADGRVGIGTTTLVAGRALSTTSLSVSGASSIGSTLNVTGTTTLNSDLTVSGNVGIGTLTPSAGLHVQSPISINPTGFGVLMGREGNNACIQMNSPTGSVNYIDFSSSGTDQLYRLLHNVTANTLQFQNSTFVTSIFMNSDGRVSIGGTSVTTGCHLTIPSGGNLDVVRAVRGQKVLGKMIGTNTTVSTDSGDPNPLTYSASAVFGGIINRQGITGNVTDTLCAATDLATEMASNSFSVAANQSIELIIRNPSSFVLTINAGTGGTMTGGNTIAAGLNKLFIIRMTSSSAYTVYAL